MTVQVRLLSPAPKPMDENKRKKLKQIGYTIKRCCMNCENSRFSPIRSWGTCSLHKYNHLKHSVQERDLSINRSGYCIHHRLKTVVLDSLDKFQEFVE